MQWQCMTRETKKIKSSDRDNKAREHCTIITKKRCEQNICLLYLMPSGKWGSCGTLLLHIGAETLARTCESDFLLLSYEDATWSKEQTAKKGKTLLGVIFKGQEDKVADLWNADVHTNKCQSVTGSVIGEIDSFCRSVYTALVKKKLLMHSYNLLHWNILSSAVFFFF